MRIAELWSTFHGKSENGAWERSGGGGGGGGAGRERGGQEKVSIHVCLHLDIYTVRNHTGNGNLDRAIFFLQPKPYI